MKKPVVGALMVLMLIFLAGCDGGTTKTLRISGIVTDSVTTLPIAGASVRAEIKARAISQEKLTNTSGAYSIDLDGIKTGNIVQMLVYKSGYFTYGYEFTYTGGTSITVNVALEPSSSVDTVNGYASLMGRMALPSQVAQAIMPTLAAPLLVLVPAEASLATVGLAALLAMLCLIPVRTR